MWHVPGIGGSQPNGSFEKERAMSSLPISHSSGALLRISKQQSKEGLSGDCWRESGFQVHVLLRLFANEKVYILHMRVQGGMSLPFLVPD